MRQRALIALTLLSTLALIGAWAQPSSEKPPAPAVSNKPGASIASVSFLTGAWRGDAEGAQVEEHWSTPAGGAIMGMFRWVDGGTTPTMYEILTIAEEPEGLTLRLRHFHPDLNVWEQEKDGPMVMRLSESTATKAIFTDPASSRVESVTYESPKPDQLNITVAFPKNSQREALNFSLKRIATK